MPRSFPAAALALMTAISAAPALAQQKLHFTYMWHMEQPVYWPDRQTSNGILGDRYERLRESLERAGTNPLNNLGEIFGLDDRWNVYQDRVRDSISDFAAFPSFGSVPEGGAQVSYSGGLIENIQSVAGTSFINGRYRADPFSAYRQARSWVTQSGPAVPRLDVVLFPFHHALMPLVDESTMRKQIQTYKAIYADAWGSSVPMSVGFFPSEMAFSTRMIGALADEGVQWSIVSGEKLSRAVANFPVTYGSGGILCDPPNKADQINPAQTDWFRLSIDRGCAPVEAFPYAFTPRRARYIDPDTGQAKSIIVVPSSQSLSWKDGYSAQGIGDFDALNAKNDPSRPMLVVLSHDGDNAWGGGYDYYRVATPNRVRQARDAGYVPTMIQRYLADHPVPANDFVHVEDGAWVNADGDFGSPQWWNWNWPLLNAAGQPDPINGWHVDARNWAVITAMQNRVDTAEQIHRASGGTITPRKIVYPHEGANAVERAWHYFMGGLNSGYMYYGSAIDMEVKPSVACNNAARFTDPIISSAGPAADTTPPTIWLPQRWPYNPGSQVFGAPYRQGNNWGPFVAPTTFTVWSFVDDVSGIQSVSLKYRLDNDGQRSLSNTENETYAGGSGVGAWQTIAMNGRVFPAANVFNDPEINFFVTPQYIARHYSAQIVGLSNKLVDYYIEAVDTRGNTKRSPIQHVYVGDGIGSGGGNTCESGVVTTLPCPPVAGQSVQVRYLPTSGPLVNAASVRLHTGINGWTNVIAPDPIMTRSAPGQPWTVTINVPNTATVLDLAFNNGSGSWDNNGGQDWHLAVTTAPPVMGRCCIGGACSIVLQTSCTGDFVAGGDCALVCPPVPTGACCSAVNACSVTAQVACAGGSVWTSGASCSPVPCGFAMDGQLDGDTVQVGSNGTMFLRVAVRGDVLYVAAPNAPAGNDRFIYLAGNAGPGVLSPANWGKAGQVAQWSALLGAEADNGYIGWQDFTVGTTSAAAKNAVIEGTINLRQEFGLNTSDPLPASVHLAFAQFPTGNGSGLVSGVQVPAGNGNGTIESMEYVRVPLCSLSPAGCCRPDHNRDSALSVGDIFLFLADWFANCQGAAAAPCSGRSADFNGSGTLDVSDIFAFLAGWFAGCT